MQLDQPITTRVMTIEDIKAECAKIGVAPSRPNIPRVRRAVTLFESGAVEHITNRIYAVRSQSDTNQIYTVNPDHEIGCDCPDAKNGWECKHQFAVKLHEYTEAENAYCEEQERLNAEYEANRFDAECNDLYDFLH